MGIPLKHSFLLSFGLGCAWLLSPESLVTAGNLAGKFGWLSLVLLVAVLLLFIFCNRLLSHQLLPDSVDKEFLILRSAFGTIPATALTIAACLPLTILATTALFVTSGYTFNEVFLYWFPNFGFAFLLLALVTLLQVLPEQVSYRAQTFFMLLTAGGLLFLSLYGIAGADAPAASLLHKPGSFSATDPALFLFIFTGITLAREKHTQNVVMVLGGTIFLLWLTASLLYVAPERLADSTIPYMTAARKIMGNPGRLLMGIVVISGSCAAVNALMLLCRQMFAQISPPFLPEKSRRWLLPLFTAICTGILMATGLAGDEVLETLLRSGLILWLSYYILLCCSSLLWLKKKPGIPLLLPFLSTLLLTGGLFTLIFGTPERTETILHIFSAISTAALLAVVWFFINKKQPTTQKETTQ